MTSAAREISAPLIQKEAEQYDASGSTTPPPYEEENSPIEQVALTVPVTDDRTLPAVTFRMWTLGTLACVLLSFLNQFFWYRREPLTITSISAQIAVVPLGRLMAATLTKRVFFEGRKWEFTLNPGPFNVKEHVLITIFANAGEGNVYAIHIVSAVKVFYKRDLTFFVALVVALTTQVLGFGWAGVCRRFLVEPAAMWWPQNLVQVSLFRALHEKEERPKGGLTRNQFFLIAFTCSFAYYVFPGYLFPMLTSFSWLWASILHRRRLSMIVDRCIIDYHPQCPINSTGRVRVYIYDTRLDGPDQEQAQYVFPVNCPIELYYYGTSYASLQDEVCPWIAKYKLEETNIRKDVRYCKIKAYVKLCTSKNPEEIEFRPPSFKIKSKKFNEEDVDCSHVAYAPKQPKLCRTRSTIDTSGRQRPLLLPGLTFQQARSSVSYPIEPTPTQPIFSQAQDPGPSISEVGSNTSNTIVLEPNELANIVGSAVAEAIKASTSQPDPNKKPLV